MQSASLVLPGEEDDHSDQPVAAAAMRSEAPRAVELLPSSSGGGGTSNGGGGGSRDSYGAGISLDALTSRTRDPYAAHAPVPVQLWTADAAGL